MFSDSDMEDKPGMMTTVSDGEVTLSWSENNMSSEMLDPKNSSVSEQWAHTFRALMILTRVFLSHPTLRDKRVSGSTLRVLM
jgi:hypothetical protein